MPERKNCWKKGRGKLGIFDPVIGSWIAEANTPMGKLTCTRIFEPVLGGKFIQLTAKWHSSKFSYHEQAIYGIKDGIVMFWSFTSDGKNSQGQIADGTDVHPEAICFEAQMPAGIARMIYWPNLDGSFNWAVESKTKKGWNRFTIHQYKALQ